MKVERRARASYNQGSSLGIVGQDEVRHPIKHFLCRSFGIGGGCASRGCALQQTHGKARY